MRKKLTLKVKDTRAEQVPAVIEALALAAQVRPLDDFWRDRAAAILLQAFPGGHAWVHKGGHHVALHGAGPMLAGCMESTPCVGRIVEDFEQKEAA